MQGGNKADPIAPAVTVKATIFKAKRIEIPPLTSEDRRVLTYRDSRNSSHCTKGCI
jgi:hypothetical protein